MEFFNELYIGNDISDIGVIVYMLKNGKEPAGIFCICKKNNGGKFMYEIMSSKELLKEIGIPITEHSKLPDIVIYDSNKEWLFLIEVVTSHGPVSPKRVIEL